MIVENGQILEIDLSNQIFAWVFAFGAVACIVVFIFNKISCYNDARHDEGKIFFMFYLFFLFLKIIVSTRFPFSIWIKMFVY